MSTNSEDFLSWFRSRGGTIDDARVGIVDFPGQGRGAVALRDIPQDASLFTIPRDITLSTRTSTLPKTLGRAWREYGLHEGWAGLILCMMWEESLGARSKCDGYIASLPARFDTPMFWNEQDLKELQGTAVVDKIGRADAERDYSSKIEPVLSSRPDLFPPEAIPQYFSLERYHLNGSRILSRSFHVEEWDGERTEGQEDDEAMDVDPEAGPSDPAEDGANAVEGDTPEATAEEIVDDTHSEDEDDEDRENPADVAMVPMADVLNARCESENAKLFYEERVLRMVSTKPIAAGEQIWNTYGDPPNSDLLRRYGHVDMIPLRPPLSGVGNPEDVVEVRADLVVTASGKGDLQERVDWWLDNADDDVFVIHTDCELPEELVSFARLLFMPGEEWEKAHRKDKLPKAKLDRDVLTLAAEVLERRLKEYPATIEADEQSLAPDRIDQLALNKKHAVVVRLGEMRILDETLRGVRRKLQAEAAAPGVSKKRSRTDESGQKGKRTKK